MRNIDVYGGNSFEFYKKVCSAKRAEDLKARLAQNDDKIEVLYSNYNNNFDDDILEELKPHGYQNPESSDLIALYKYKIATIQKLCVALTTVESKRKMKCQNCTIGEVGSFDHLLPQKEFPEFAVNPKNLFPSCTKCNSIKSSIWRDESGRSTLNLYLDSLPNVQYLFVEADIGSTTIDIRFYLENRKGINDRLFQRIVKHYETLDLLNRFAENVDDVITSFKNTLTPWIGVTGVDVIKEKTLESIEKEKIALGFNYWQTVLKLELINNEDFLIDFQTAI